MSKMQQTHTTIGAISSIVFLLLVLSALNPMWIFSSNDKGKTVKDYSIQKSEEEWKQTLTPEQYSVLRKKGTEKPGTGALLHNKEEGSYHCAACGARLFDSEHKFESGSGWPSFFTPSDSAQIAEQTDATFGMVRTEVVCSRCGGHLGHVFEDGPKPTGLRYCINSASLRFIEHPSPSAPHK